MATLQTVPHVAQQSQPAVVIPFSKPAPAAISQVDLEEAILFKRLAREAQEKLEAKEAELRGKLEAGAAIEEGVHTARLKESFRKNVSWKDVVIRLAERLKLGGESYCEKVLASTKPSRTVSLVVE
jgi:hypothetical protein